MKKRTLISTLAMVVIVALALTTATFAWYSSNSSVTAKSTATAAVSSGANLTIGKTLNEAKGTDTEGKAPISITLASGLNLDPAAPETNIKTTAPTGITSADDAAALFYTATVNDLDEFTSDKDNATVLTADFFVYNNSAAGSKAITPTVTLTVSDPEDENAVSAKNLLRVALFVIDKDTGSWDLKEVLAVSGQTAVYGEIVEGDEAFTETFATATSKALDSIAAADSVHIGIVAWLDGKGLTGLLSGATCDFSLDINGVEVTTPAP